MGQITLKDLSIMILEPNQIIQNSIYETIENVVIGRGIKMPLLYTTQSKGEAIKILNNNRNNLWGIIMRINTDTGKSPQEAIAFMDKLDQIGIPIPIIGYSTIQFTCNKPFQRKIQILPKNQNPSVRHITDSLNYFNSYHTLMQALNQKEIKEKEIKAA